MDEQPKSGKSAIVVSVIGAIATLGGIFLSNALSKEDTSTAGITSRDIIEQKDCYLVSLHGTCITFRNIY